MIDSVLAALVSFILWFISQGGLVGVAALMALEAACLPLPSEVIMPFAGYLVTTGRFDLISVATAGAIGCNLGSWVAYYIGVIGGRPLVKRWGRYLLIRHEDVDRADHFFQRYGALTVFICRLLPMVRSFIALPAGYAGMKQIPFHIYTFIGSWIWCYGLAYAGMKLGETWDRDPTLHHILRHADTAIIVLLLVGVAWFLWRHLKTRSE